MEMLTAPSIIHDYCCRITCCGGEKLGGIVSQYLSLLENGVGMSDVFLKMRVPRLNLHGSTKHVTFVNNFNRYT